MQEELRSHNYAPRTHPVEIAPARAKRGRQVSERVKMINRRHLACDAARRCIW
jgi:hypothetical protein